MAAVYAADSCVLHGGLCNAWSVGLYRWAADYARQAQTHDALARQHEAAAEILEKQGDSEGAEISRRAMNEERRAARRDQFDAEKDLWLSQW